MNYTQTKLAIDQLIQKVQSYGQLSSEQLKRLNHKFRLEWNYNSNSMEGNTLTVAETRSVMIGNLDVRRKPLKDVLEVKGHDEVISEILRIGKGEIRLSEKRIKEIHKGIMYEEDPALRDKIGIWKQEANEIINHKGEKYLFVLPEEIPEKIHDLLNRTNAKIDLIQMRRKDAPHPVDVALSFHLEYLNIHPFYDGNGRTARILSNLILVALGYPPFWITENERGVYYRYIADIQCYGGREEDLFNYLGELILRSQQMICDVLDGKSIEDEDDIDKEIELLKRELKVKVISNENSKQNEVIHKNYVEVIRVLFQNIEESLKKYTGLFESINSSYSYVFKTIEEVNVEGFLSNCTYTNVTVGATLSDLNQEIQWWRDIYSIELHIGLECLKLIDKPSDIYLKLSCSYNPSTYVIKIEQNDIISKKYNEVLTEDEMTEINKKVNVQILNRIKVLQNEFK